MSAEKEVPTMICLPVAWGKEPIAGATQSVCAFCSQAVWLSPSGAARVAGEGPMALGCITCVQKQVTEAKKPVKHMPLNEAQMIELKDDVIRRMGQSHGKRHRN